MFKYFSKILLIVFVINTISTAKIVGSVLNLGEKEVSSSASESTQKDLCKAFVLGITGRAIAVMSCKMVEGQNATACDDGDIKGNTAFSNYYAANLMIIYSPTFKSVGACCCLFDNTRILI